MSKKLCTGLSFEGGSIVFNSVIRGKTCTDLSHEAVIWGEFCTDLSYRGEFCTDLSYLGEFCTHLSHKGGGAVEVLSRVLGIKFDRQLAENNPNCVTSLLATSSLTPSLDF